MSTMTRTATVALLLTCAVGNLGAQEGSNADQAAYFRAVAEFYRMPRNEISILGDSQLPPDQIPVVLFIARRAGVSPEAILALHRSGESWVELSKRYKVDAAQLHVPLPDEAPAGPLAEVYTRYRALPPDRWGEIKLTDRDILTLVNVRVLAQTLKVSPAKVLAAADGGGTFVEVYARMIRGSG